jgi:hypothetical protein
VTGKSTMKAFDAVEMMRSTRTAIGATIATMSVDEQNEWLDSNPPTDPALHRLFMLAAQQRESVGIVEATNDLDKSSST